MDINHPGGEAELNGTSEFTNHFTGEVTKGTFLGSLDKSDSRNAVVGNVTQTFGDDQLTFNVAFTEQDSLKIQIDSVSIGGCTGVERDQTRYESSFFLANADRAGNSSLKTATVLEESTRLESVEIRGGEINWYKLELEQLELVRLDLLTSSYDFGSNLFLETGKRLPLELYDGSSVYISLDKGVYYFAVYPGLPIRTTYSLGVERSPAPDADLEPNDSPETATVLDLTQPVSLDAYLRTGDADWYTFTLAEFSIIEPAISFNEYSDTPPEIGRRYSDEDEIFLAESHILSPGVPYYIPLDRSYERLEEDAPWYPEQLEVEPDLYTLSLSATPAPEDSYEPNNQKLDAAPLKLGERVLGYVKEGNEDWFSFNIGEAKEYQLSFGVGGSSYDTDLSLIVYDENGNSYEEYFDYGYDSSQTGIYNRTTYPLNFEAGEYYVHVTSPGWISYEFSVSEKP